LTNIKLCFLIVNLLEERALHLADYRIEADCFKLQLAAADAGVGEKIVDQGIETLCGTADSFRIIAPGFVQCILVIVKQRLSETLLRTQRSAQIVRNRVTKGFELLRRFL